MAEDDFGMSAFSFGPDDVPEEVRRFIEEQLERGPDAGFSGLSIGDLPPTIQQALGQAKQNFEARQQAMKSLEDDVSVTLQPSEAQLKLVPGDRVFVLDPQDELDETVLGTIVEPLNYTEEFPDYEERLFNGFVLCKYVSSALENDEELGWFPRVTLIGVTDDEHWASFWRQLRGEEDTDMTAWRVKLAVEFFQGISHANLDKDGDTAFPQAQRCRRCDSTAVLLELRHNHVSQWYCGPNTEAGRGKEVAAIAKADTSCVRDALITCLDCGLIDDAFEHGYDVLVGPNAVSEVSQH